MPYDFKHMEDWDFAEMCESPPYRLHGDAVQFVQSVHVLVRDSLRVQLLWSMVEHDYGDFDGTFVTPTLESRSMDSFFDGLRGRSISLARLRGDRKIHRDVVESLRREYTRDRRMRLTRLPPDVHAAVIDALGGMP